MIQALVSWRESLHMTCKVLSTKQSFVSWSCDVLCRLFAGNCRQAKILFKKILHRDMIQITALCKQSVTKLLESEANCAIVLNENSSMRTTQENSSMRTVQPEQLNENSGRGVPRPFSMVDGQGYVIIGIHYFVFVSHIIFHMFCFVFVWVIVLTQKSDIFSHLIRNRTDWNTMHHSCRCPM